MQGKNGLKIWSFTRGEFVLQMHYWCIQNVFSQKRWSCIIIIIIINIIIIIIITRKMVPITGRAS